MDTFHVSHNCVFRKDEELATVYKKKFATSTKSINCNVIIICTHKQIS